MPHGSDDELSRLRAETRELRSVVFELVGLLRAHIANVAIFNQEQLRNQMLDRLEELSKRETEVDV